ncbi:MAG: hypothetical protein LBO21_04580 [Synergistaceae bacterium]|jgi:alkylhydroperoxidase family enzyme|nr:hypothetical protein [Synergistaceae bacterium]
MSKIVDYVKKSSLCGEALKVYEDREKNGKLTNMVGTLLHSWPSFTAMEFYPIRNELIKVVGERAVYLYCYAISVEDECPVCSIYHSKLLDEIGIGFEESCFTDTERVLVDYGRALARDANHINEDIYKRLKDNFSDAEIVLITAVGCKMIASNLFNSALRVEPAS